MNSKIFTTSLLMITLLLSVSALDSDAFAAKDKGNSTGGLGGLSSVVDALAVALDDAITSLTGLISANTAAIDSETDARSTADADLQNQINTIELTPGPQGDQGIHGETGATGPQGEAGTNGADADSAVTDALAKQIAALDARIAELEAGTDTTSLIVVEKVGQGFADGDNLPSRAYVYEITITNNQDVTSRGTLVDTFTNPDPTTTVVYPTGMSTECKQTGKRSVECDYALKSNASVTYWVQLDMTEVRSGSVTNTATATDASTGETGTDSITNSFGKIAQEPLPKEEAAKAAQ